MFEKGDLLQSNVGNFQVLVTRVNTNNYTVTNASDFTPNAEWELTVPKHQVAKFYHLAEVQGKVKIRERQSPYFKVRKKLTHT